MSEISENRDSKITELKKREAVAMEDLKEVLKEPEKRLLKENLKEWDKRMLDAYDEDLYLFWVSMVELYANRRLLAIFVLKIFQEWSSIKNQPQWFTKSLKKSERILKSGFFYFDLLRDWNKLYPNSLGNINNNITFSPRFEKDERKHAWGAILSLFDILYDSDKASHIKAILSQNTYVQYCDLLESGVDSDNVEYKRLTDAIIDECKHILTFIQKINELIEKTFIDTSVEESYNWICSVEPKDYLLWNEEQKHELEMIASLIRYTVQLIQVKL